MQPARVVRDIACLTLLVCAGGLPRQIAAAVRQAPAPLRAPPGSHPTPETMPAGTRGVWIDVDELMRRPTAGPAWDELLRDAERNPGVADISDQDSRHDVFTLAAALVCVRTGAHCDKATKGVLDAIGTEASARWLAVGRNLGAYVIAADLLDLRAHGARSTEGAVVERWLAGFMSKPLADNNTEAQRSIEPFQSGANASAQEGFVFTALAAYLRDARALERAWGAYRAFVCDSSASNVGPVELRRAVSDGWAHDDRQPCAINPAGSVKVVVGESLGLPHLERIDGAIIADMRRGGRFQSRPIYTDYPWIGLQGLVPAAVVLERAGYPAFEAADRALLRAHDYLWYLRETTGEKRWFDGSRAREIVHLINAAYGVSFPVAEVVGAGRTIGYTSWTHPL